MNLELKPKHYVGIGLGFFILLLDFIFFFNFMGEFGPSKWYFNPILVISFIIGGVTFFFDFLAENKRQKEMEVKFLEFVRSLVETVKSGVSIPVAIQQVSKANYGSLTPYIKKLSNQIEWGYPLHDALQIFANDTKNMVIKRSIAIVMQAEKSGGDIGSVLQSVSQSVFETKKIKEERKSQSYNQLVQGYIIFFVFIGIMLVLKVYLIPKLSDIGGEVVTGLAGAGVGGASSGAVADLGGVFILAIVIQGLFAGLMIGKFAEGKFKLGLKHSAIMVLGGYLLMSTISGLAEGVTTLLFLIPTKWLTKKR